MNDGLSVIVRSFAVAEKLGTPIVLGTKRPVLGKARTTSAVEVPETDAADRYALVGVAPEFVKSRCLGEIFVDAVALF